MSNEYRFLAVVREIVDRAPPLTGEQILKLRTIFEDRSGCGGDVSPSDLDLIICPWNYHG